MVAGSLSGDSIDQAIKGSIEWIDFSLIQPRAQKWLERHPLMR